MTNLVQTLATPSSPLPAGCSLIWPSGYTRFAPTGSWNGKRAYLYPGLDVQVADWTTGPPATLLSNLQSEGWDVYVLPLPTPQACFFTNGGWQYREQFVASINAAVDAIEAANGVASYNLVGGISFGGLHSMIAAASVPRFDAWFAHVPVTRIANLTEFPSVGDVGRMNQYFAAAALSDTTGWLSWGTADTRTGWQYTKLVSRSLGAGVTLVEYAGQDHSTNAQNIADITAWINSH